MQVPELFRYLAAQQASSGPEIWCTRCSRRHPRRRCSLNLLKRTVTHDRRRGRRQGRPDYKRMHWSHESPPEHALTSIVQDESADDAMRMACADMIFTYASSYYVGRDEDDDDKDKTEGKPDE
jgi:hypothetical protein